MMDKQEPGEDFPPVDCQDKQQDRLPSSIPSSAEAFLEVAMSTVRSLFSGPDSLANRIANFNILSDQPQEETQLQDSRLDALWHKGAEFLGTRYAILGGAMTWVSDRHLVSAISNAGGFGVLASGSMSPEILREEIEATRRLTREPFGVNLITMHPQLFELIEVCRDLNVSHVVLAGGLPSAKAIAALKGYGAKIMGFAPALVIAKKLIRSGIDALVIEGNEAGGHIGPVSTGVLAQEILPHVKDIPVFVAGGIGRGDAMVTYLEWGAAGCQLGTRFVCATECQAHPNFKKAFLRSHARDALSTTQLDSRLPVIPVRALANQATKDFADLQRTMVEKMDAGEVDLKTAQAEIEQFWVGALRRAAIDGDMEHGSLMAGQSVGLVTREQSMNEILQELVQQAVDFMDLREPTSPVEYVRKKISQYS